MKIRMWGGYDFIFEGTNSKNIRQKWLSICFNINYEDGTMEFYLNGRELKASQMNPMKLPNKTDILIVRLGRYFFDDTPLIGKIYDFNLWDELLSQDELTNFTQCLHYKPISKPGTLINPETNWNLSGRLHIEKKQDMTFFRVKLNSKESNIRRNSPSSNQTHQIVDL